MEIQLRTYIFKAKICLFAISNISLNFIPARIQMVTAWVRESELMSAGGSGF